MDTQKLDQRIEAFNKASRLSREEAWAWASRELQAASKIMPQNQSPLCFLISLARTARFPSSVSYGLYKAFASRKSPPAH